MSQTFNEIPQWIKDIPPFVSAAVAFVALVVALVHVAIHWRNYRRDRHDVKVELQWNAETVTITGSSTLRYLGRITVTNKGRRPVHIDGVYLELPGRELHINWLDESKRLEEADRPIRIPIAQDSTLEPFVDSWRKIFATSVDISGATYKSKHGGERPIITPGQDPETFRRLREIKLPRHWKKAGGA